MALAVYKATMIWKEDKKLRGMNLIGVIIQDQVFYFIVYVSYLSTLAVVIIIGNHLGLSFVRWSTS